MQIVRESPILQELLAQERQLGIEEGREEGEHKATLKVLYQILSIRFGIVSTDFSKQLEALSLKTLEQLTETALTVETLAEFENVLANLPLEATESNRT